MNCLDASTLRSRRPEIVRCEHQGSRPSALIGPPTHRRTVQASLTTGVASYHSSVVKVHRPARPAGSRRPSGGRLYHSPLSHVKRDEKPMQSTCLCIGPKGSRSIRLHVWFCPCLLG